MLSVSGNRKRICKLSGTIFGRIEMESCYILFNDDVMRKPFYAGQMTQRVTSRNMVARA